MNNQIDPKLWNGELTDIAYNDPYSEITNKTRNKVLLFSSFIVLNFFFPLDLKNSQFIGMKFEEGSGPPLSGIMALLVLYFTVRLIIYSFQELQAWRAQAQTLDFTGSRRNLHDIYAHHQSISNSVAAIGTQIAMNTDAATELSIRLDKISDPIRQEIEGNLSSMGVTKDSLDNMIPYFEKSNDEFGKEILNAKSNYRRAIKAYKMAMKAQLVKVLFLETALPLIMAAISLYIARDGISKVIGAALEKLT